MVSGSRSSARRATAACAFIPAFQDERVRRALFRTLDYQLIAALEGAAADHPTGPVGPSFAADALPPVELAAHPLFSHDPGEARKAA